MSQGPVPFYSRESIYAIEALSIKSGMSGKELVERAGKAAFRFVQTIFPQKQTIVVFCGRGGKGGSGYILAREAQQNGWTVLVRSLGHNAELTKEATHAKGLCREAGIIVKGFDPKEKIQADLWVDALWGIGLDRPLDPDSQEVIEYLNRSGGKILSIDIPSGSVADTGKVFGGVVHADWTITFIGMKTGFFLGEVIDHCGVLVCDDLNLPASVFEAVRPSALGITDALFAPFLGPRSKRSHKGNFGHVVVVGGCTGESGAPRLSALGASRVGAGLVTIGTQSSHAHVMNIEQPEWMSVGIDRVSDLLDLLKLATVVVIGPGLGRSSWSRSVLKLVLETELPLILDADALNLLSEFKVHPRRDRWVLTPHPGEAARLLKTTIETIERDRLRAATQLQETFQGIAVLKGARTVISVAGEVPSICLQGNPGMASGGMGDLLTGVIAGLIAQGFPLPVAAKLGVCLHAHAGDSAISDGERGLLASDLAPWIRRCVNPAVSQR